MRKRQAKSLREKCFSWETSYHWDVVQCFAHVQTRHYTISRKFCNFEFKENAAMKVLALTGIQPLFLVLNFFGVKFAKRFTITLNSFLQSSYNVSQSSCKLLTNVLQYFLQTSYKCLANFLQSSYILLKKFLHTSYKVLTYFSQISHKLLTNF